MKDRDKKRLILFYFLGYRPEKQSPFYTDQPQYYTEQGEPTPFHPGNFWPDEDFNHLIIVAKKLGLTDLPVDIGFAYHIVTTRVEALVEWKDVKEAIYGKMLTYDPI